MAANPFSESAVLRDCLDILRAYSVLAWRNNSGAFAAGTGSARRFIRAGIKGSADIFAILPPDGRFLAIETKRPGVKGLQTGGKVSPDQAEFLAQVRDAGGIGIVLNDPEKLLTIFDVLSSRPGATFNQEGDEIK